MAIQKVWLHGHKCDCDDCPSTYGNSLKVSADRDGKSANYIPLYKNGNTIIKDQYGQRYIITPIPDME